MSWVRVEPEAPLHPKHFRGGVAAFGFDVAGTAYCLRNRTDGLIPTSDLGLIYPGLTPKQALALATKLVEVGRWERVDGGWCVHDYAHYQPTKEDLIDEDRKRHERSVAGGKARASIAARINGRFVARTAPAKPPAKKPATSPAAGWLEAGTSPPASDQPRSRSRSRSQELQPPPTSPAVDNSGDRPPEPGPKVRVESSDQGSSGDADAVTPGNVTALAENLAHTLRNGPGPERPRARPQPSREEQLEALARANRTTAEALQAEAQERLMRERELESSPGQGSAG